MTAHPDRWIEADRALRVLAPMDVHRVRSKDGTRVAGAPPLAQIEPPAASSKSLAELMSNPDLLREPRRVLPFLAVENATTLFVAREKTGKSTLCSEGIAAMLNGEAFLGVNVAGCGPVVWFAIDEPLRDTVQRFARIVRNTGDLFINDVPRTHAELLTHLRAELSARPSVRLVVIDTLSRVLQQSGIDTNDAREVGPVIRAIVEILRELGVAGILIYHTGKSGEEYAGSVAFGATVDEVVTLRRRGRRTGGQGDSDTELPSEDDGKRWLVCTGRRLRGIHALEFDGNAYSLCGEAETVDLRILKAAHRAGAPIAKGALAGAAGGRRQDTLTKIDHLCHRGVLAISSGRYSITHAGRKEIGVTAEHDAAPTGAD